MGLCLYFVKERNILLSRQCFQIYYRNRIQMPQLLHIVAGPTDREQVIDIIIKRTNGGSRRLYLLERRGDTGAGTALE